MDIVTEKWILPKWLAFLIIFCFLTGLLSVWYYKVDGADVKLVGLIGGLVSGLLVFILTFITTINPLQKLDKFEKMGIRAVLANRHDKAYYQKIVVGSRKVVRVMGASCTRFVDDFLDRESDDKVLIDAMRAHQKLVIQLLIPNDAFMEAESKARVPGMLRKLVKLKAEFGDRVELRRFDERAQHSFVIVDNELIAGPIFESDKSKHGPAVHVAMTTHFAQKYSQHFDDIWSAGGTVG